MLNIGQVCRDGDSQDRRDAQSIATGIFWQVMEAMNVAQRVRLTDPFQ